MPKNVRKCCERTEQKKIGSGYIKSNKELANEVINVLNLIKDMIENKVYEIFFL